MKDLGGWLTARGHIFRSGDFWFLCYRDTLLEAGQLVRKQVCRKITSVEPDHMRLKKPPARVLEMAEQTIRPINAGELQPDKNVTLKDLVERIYFVNMQGQKRESTLKGYRARWDSQPPQDVDMSDCGNSEHPTRRGSWLKLAGQILN